MNEKCPSACVFTHQLAVVAESPRCLIEKGSVNLDAAAEAPDLLNRLVVALCGGSLRFLAKTLELEWTIAAEARGVALLLLASPPLALPLENCLRGVAGGGGRYPDPYMSDEREPNRLSALTRGPAQQG